MRQAILAKIDALVNIGSAPKMAHTRQKHGRWPAHKADREYLASHPEELASTASFVIGGLLPMVEHKGLEMGVLRCVMELLCAACVLQSSKLGDCLSCVTEGMIGRLGGEGVLSRVEKEMTTPGDDYSMLANDTEDTNLEGTQVPPDGEEEEEEDVAGMSSMDEDDWDDWDDAEDDIFNEDALITEFGRFLEGLTATFPELEEKKEEPPSKANISAGGVPSLPSTPPALKVPGRKPLAKVVWPGVGEDSRRVLNWLVDKHARIMSL